MTGYYSKRAMAADKLKGQLMNEQKEAYLQIIENGIERIREGYSDDIKTLEVMEALTRKLRQDLMAQRNQDAT